MLYSFQCMDLVHILLNMSLNISFLFMQMIFLYFSVHLFIANDTNGASLVVQWLGLCTLTMKGPGSIPDQGTKTP